MQPHTRLTCDCGGELRRPLPRNCPHCGRLIVAVRSPPLAWIWPTAFVVGMFVLLIGGLVLLLQWFGR